MALPPWIARMYNACASTKAMPSRLHRSASRYQGEHAFDRHHQIVAESFDCGEERLRCGCDVTRQGARCRRCPECTGTSAARAGRYRNSACAVGYKIASEAPFPTREGVT